MPDYDAVIRRVIPEVEFHQNRYSRELGEQVSDGCRWLDIGAGNRLHSGWTGFSEKQLARRCVMLVGCDLEVEHLRENKNLTAAVGADARHLPFADESFDLVTANMVLEHLAAPEAVFSEIGRILAPGGKFVFLTPHLGNPWVRIASIVVHPSVRRRIAVLNEGRSAEHVFITHYAANTPRRIAGLAESAGLEVGRIEVFPSYPMIRRPWVLTYLECLWLRAQRSGRLRERVGSNLIGLLRKKATP
jgi:SAM-dependent methyltransferase